MYNRPFKCLSEFWPWNWSCHSYMQWKENSQQFSSLTEARGWSRFASAHLSVLVHSKVACAGGIGAGGKSRSRPILAVGKFSTRISVLLLYTERWSYLLSSSSSSPLSRIVSCEKFSPNSGSRWWILCGWLAFDIRKSFPYQFRR